MIFMAGVNSQSFYVFMCCFMCVLKGFIKFS